MNDEAHIKVQGLLKEIFNNVNSWLTHAEAKNGAIIAFNIACLSFLWGMKGNHGAKVLNGFSCIIILSSTIMALISFFPKTDKSIVGRGGHAPEDNLIFYKDIVKYNKEDYVKAVFLQYTQINIPDAEIQKLEMDLSDEITYNAEIVIRKYKFFGYAVKIDIFALALLVALAMIMA